MIKPEIFSPAVSARTLTVGCTGGLCNRLRLLVSGLMLAEVTGRSFRMLWPRNENCAAGFHELFTNDWPVEDATGAAVWALPNYAGWFAPPLPNVLTFGGVHLGINTYSLLLQPSHSADYEKLMVRCHEYFSALQPRPELAARIADFQARHFRPCMIGVHLRRGDFQRHRRDASANTGAALRGVQRFLYRRPSAGILLCTDDGALAPDGTPMEAEGVREKFRARFGDRVVWTEPRSLDRQTDPVAIQDAVIDLWLLRATEAVVGTGGSSFSEQTVFGRPAPILRCYSKSWSYLGWRLAWQLTGIYGVMRWAARRRYGRNIPFPILLNYHRNRWRYRKAAWLKARMPAYFSARTTGR